MGTIVSMFDGLVNAVTGMGGRRDPRVSAVIAAPLPLSNADIDAAYRGSGLMRKIVRIPAIDMVREWRDWKIDKDKISDVEAEEKRLGVRRKVRDLEILRRLGGGALILGLPGNPSEPAPATVAKGGLAYIHAVSRWQISFTTLVDDARRGDFGEPEMWRMTTAQSGQVDIHPSRVIAFRGDTSASQLMGLTGNDAFWGESEVAKVLDAVKDNETARAAFASLLHKARLLRIGIPNLMDTVSTATGEANVMKRLSVLAMAESVHNASVYDAGDGEGKGGERIDDVAYNFAGARDMLLAFAEFVAAISDIPFTRLYGRAPEGMNASGESQQIDWRKTIRAMQTLDLAPCLDRLDPYLLQSALGAVPDGQWYDFAPLDSPGDKENADRFLIQMQAIDKLQTTGTIPEEALAKGVQSLMVDEGYLPELEAALEAIPEDERYGISNEPTPEEIAAMAEATKGGGQDLGGGGAIGSVPARRAANDAWFFADAVEKPLYVQRKLLNADDLISWAKSNGFTSTLTADDMHVTVLYSRSPVDPMKMGEDWSSDANGTMRIKPGGPRAIERLGEDAVVLLFGSWALVSRHNDMVRAGGSHDYPEYQPHVTISYGLPDGVDISTLKAFTGELHFGPEIFEPLDLDWKQKVVEDGGSRTSDRPFDDGRIYRRDKNGRFASSNGSASSIKSFLASTKPGEHKSLEIGIAGGKSPPHVHGYARRIQSGQVEHAIKEHGDRKREAARGQLPLTRSDIAQVPRIVADAHSVTVKGAMKRGGKPQSITYVARIGKREYGYVETVGTKREQVVFKTMWKK